MKGQVVQDLEKFHKKLDNTVEKLLENMDDPELKGRQAITMFKIASCYHALGNYGAAEEYLKAIVASNFSPKDLKAISMRELITLYQDCLNKNYNPEKDAGRRVDMELLGAAAGLYPLLGEDEYSGCFYQPLI